MESRLLQSFLLFSFVVVIFGFPSQDVCLQKLDEGPCRATLQRFYYNTLTQQCEEFSYGGCLGNSNNFKTFEDCQKTCWRIPKIPKICRLEKDEGPCRSLIKRYFFNMTSMQCEDFFYGGCYGNDNRFHNHASCLDYCQAHKTTPAICLGRLDKGLCSASIPRYYYNPTSKLCEEFLYSGCGGSSNNFVSRQRCAAICMKGRKPLGNKDSNKIRRKILSGKRLKS